MRYRLRQSEYDKRVRRSSRRRGTAMMETIFSLLLITLILSFLFFFGRGVVRVQKSQVMDRYEAWREVARSWGPGSNNHLGGPQLNQTFFADNAASITQGGSHFFPHDASAQSGVSYIERRSVSNPGSHYRESSALPTELRDGQKCIIYIFTAKMYNLLKLNDSQGAIASSNA